MHSAIQEHTCIEPSHAPLSIILTSAIVIKGITVDQYNLSTTYLFMLQADIIIFYMAD